MPFPRLHDLDPTARIPYQIDWTRPLAGGTLASAAWTITPSGPTLTAPTFSATRSQVYVSGGTDGVTYELTCTATKTGDSYYLDPRTVEIRCRKT
jgi:hypothetical protein